MGRIIIENLDGKSIDYNDNTKRLLDVLLEEVDWMHACGGKGRCTTCKAVILSTSEELPELNESELRFKALGRLNENERLACQFQLKNDNDLTIRVHENNKLPHLNYSE